MLSLLKNYKGSVEINGNMYNNISEAISSYTNTSGKVCIRLNVKNDLPIERNPIEEVKEKDVHAITVKAYMTRPATIEFDFMEKWNNNVPMPLRTMVGTVEKETKGMVYMKLHGDITATRTMRCLCCGKVITNPVSQYFGMGPKCGGHEYVNPFYSKEELEAAVSEYRKNVLHKIAWEGWIIKSAIISDEIIEEVPL